jgi:hypothetical protein
LICQSIGENTPLTQTFPPEPAGFSYDVKSGPYSTLVA